MRARRRPQPAFPSQLSTSSTARTSGRLFESPGGSEATPSGCARAPPLSRRIPRLRPAGPAPSSRWTLRPRPATSTSSSASSTTARPSAQLLQVARRLGGYTQWVRSRAPTQSADSASASGRASRPDSAGGLRVRVRQASAPISRRTPCPHPTPSTSP